MSFPLEISLESMSVIPRFYSLLAACFLIGTPSVSFGAVDRPNILFISLDDLNDWVGCLGGHPQSLTPNMDRLAKSGVLFTNAHAPAASCNPSRTAIFTGRAPNQTGVYSNNQKMRGILPKDEIIPKVLSRQGYHSAGAGKLLHYFIDAPSWNDYFPEAEKENPFPRTLYPEKRPLNLPVGGAWHYRETDWGALEVSDEKYGGDYLVTEWVSEQLQQKREKPFFLACGIYRPHEPWFVPAEYFKPFPLESIQLPPGYLEGDIDDLPPQGKRRGPNRYLDYIRSQGQWKQAIQSYLASIHYADAMVGRVLDALEKGPNADNTIVVLWSDHGWHLGEKEHWQKYTAWRACTRVPLIIRVPSGAPGLSTGTAPAVSNKPVSLLSLFPTLLELCGLPAQSEHDGPSLIPLLKDPAGAWPHVAITHLSDPGSYGLSAERWRLIHYANGEEELYDIDNDPHEWVNLAAKTEFGDQITSLRSLGPTSFKKVAAAAAESKASLALQAWSEKERVVSNPQGSPFRVEFDNQSESVVRLYWLNLQGEKQNVIEISAASRKAVRTREGAAWLVTDLKDRPLGFFRIGARSAKAIIPDF